MSESANRKALKERREAEARDAATKEEPVIFAVVKLRLYHGRRRVFKNASYAFQLAGSHTVLIVREHDGSAEGVKRDVRLHWEDVRDIEVFPK